MPVCSVCNNEMTLKISCDPSPVTLKKGRKVFSRIKYGDEGEDWGAAEGRPCGDCECPPGGYHHLGCDIERCPVCNGQLLSCSCALL